MLSIDLLSEMYTIQQLSATEIAKRLGCSANKVNYWLERHKIQKRSISDAIYLKHNPNGDPFSIARIDTLAKAQLYGMGLGLYWGEGTKANKHSVRLGNSDPELIKVFMRFLVELYGVEKNSLRFGLQVFSDINPASSLAYWTAKLDVEESQLYKVHITPSNSIGTYRQKNKHGVVTIYYHNKRLRDIIVNALPRQDCLIAPR